MRILTVLNSKNLTTLYISLNFFFFHLLLRITMSDWDDWPTQTSATAAKPSAPVSHNDDDWSPVDKKAPQGDDWESPPAPKANREFRNHYSF